MLLPYFAVIVATVLAPTAVVDTVNVPEVAPPATVTLAGVVADALLSWSVTTIPPAGAAPFKVTLPVELVPPVTAVGLRVNETIEIEGGFTVNVAETVAL